MLSINIKGRWTLSAGLTDNLFRKLYTSKRAPYIISKLLCIGHMFFKEENTLINFWVYGYNKLNICCYIQVTDSIVIVAIEPSK